MVLLPRMFVWGTAESCTRRFGHVVSSAERAHRLADQRRSLAGAALLRLAAGSCQGRAPSTVSVRRVCAACGGEHGRPLLDDGYWGSISHAGDVACAVVTLGGPVGIDIEPRSREVDPRLVDEIVAPDDPCRGAAGDPLVLWTRKEAVLKATGEGLTTSPRDVWVSPSAAPAALIRHRGRPSLVVSLTDVTSVAGYVGAVAFVVADARDSG